VGFLRYVAWRDQGDHWLTSPGNDEALASPYAIYELGKPGLGLGDAKRLSALN
jgi:hypothetical protein